MGANSESPVIILPDDPILRTRLERKLKEYQQRESKYLAPREQMDTICKEAVLRRLLQDGQVFTYDLSWEMAQRYGSSFSVSDFNNACAVIHNYTVSDEAEVRGGTGLS